LQGQALQHLSRYNEAINSYNKVIETDNNPLILTRRGSIYRVLNQFDQALKDTNQAIKFDPRYAEGYINRGLIYYQLGNNQQALINLNHVISSITREDSRAYLARGFIYEKLGENIQAKADFIRAFRLYQQEIETKTKNQEIDLQSDKYAHLYTDFNYIMQLNIEESNIYLGQGVAYSILDKKQQAIDSLTQAQKLFQTQRDKFGQDLTQQIITQVQKPVEQSSTKP
jgi:tetratricopeptide (TPR) repeat protein